MSVILALDQGTTSSRAIVFDRDGAIVAFDQREFPQHFPHPGWVEHDPEAIWESQCATAVGALRNAHLSAADVAAIGITNQRETTILWDRTTGKSVANAIVWQDRRTAALCEELKADGLEQLVTETTGLLIDPYFSATKIRWLLDHVDGLRARAEAGEIAFGTVDSWLIWKLTAGKRHVTDVTNASRTLLFDIHALRWSDELLAALEIPASILPEVLPSCADFGTTAPEIFGGPIPIAGLRVTSRPRSSARPASRRDSRRTRTVPARSSSSTPARALYRVAKDCSRRSRSASSLGRRRTRSKARSSSPAQRCSGCATGSA